MAARADEVTELTVRLPRAMVEKLRSEVDAGRFHTLDEAVREGVEEHLHEEETFRHWVQTDVIPSYQRYVQDPAGEMTAEDVRGWIDERFPADH